MNNAFTFMSMLPEFKCKRGPTRGLCTAWRLNLTTASNCESIRPIIRQVSGFTVAQQPVNFTRFLFNSILLSGECSPEIDHQSKERDGEGKENF
jgi:hypothetical protein